MNLLGWVSRLRRRGPLRGRALGRAGEREAARLLRRTGFRILGANVRTPVGEADLVALDPDGRTVVIVEVKCRARAPGDAEGFRPEAAITAHKRAKLVQVARSLGKRRRYAGRPMRIDVVTVVWSERADHELRHYRDAVRP